MERPASGPICGACVYDIVNGFEGWNDAPATDQYNHAETIARILQLTGLTFQQAKFKFLRRHVEEWSGKVSEEMKKAAPHQKSDQELKEWNAVLDCEMVKLRQLCGSACPAGNSIRLLAWQDVAMAMSAAFKEWDAPDAQEWLKGAWEKVAAADQATYQDNLEYTEVVLRLIALFDFYREFSDLFADRCGIPTEETVARALKLEKQNVMLLIGKHGAYDAFSREGFAEDLFFDGAISYLCKSHFSEEVQVILLRGSSSAEWIFATLLSSVEAPTPAWWHEDTLDATDDTLFGGDYCIEQAGWYQWLTKRWQMVNNESR